MTWKISFYTLEGNNTIKEYKSFETEGAYSINHYNHPDNSFYVVNKGDEVELSGLNSCAAVECRNNKWLIVYENTLTAVEFFNGEIVPAKIWLWDVRKFIREKEQNNLSPENLLKVFQRKGSEGLSQYVMNCIYKDKK